MEVKILREKEKDLVLALKDEDILSLAVASFESRIIGRDVLERVQTLDRKNLRPHLMVSYILEHVYEEISGKSDLLLTFLNRLKCTNKALERLCQSCEENLLDLERYYDLSRSSRKYPRGTQGNADRDVIFCEADVPILTELLIQGSFKWEEIGTSLHLPKHEMEECRMSINNAMRLSNVLYRWITSKGKMLPSTLRALKVALNSELVGLPSLVSGLEEKFTDKMKEKLVSPKRVPSNNRSMHITYQSSDTTIDDSKSALLGVKVSPDNSDIQYQWMLDGYLLSNGDPYYGVDKPILFVHFVNHKTEGKYRCRVKSGDEVVESDEIVLKVAYPIVTQHLKCTYAHLPELPKQNWPPVASHKFISPSLILKEDSYCNDSDYAVCQYIEDTIEIKAAIQYDELFQSYMRGSLILIEGRPGCGKTTLAHNLARDWSSQKMILSSVKALVLVPLRHFSGEKSDFTLANILEKYLPNPKDRDSALEYFNNLNGEGICFIIDGLDEIDFQDCKQTFVYKLIYKQLLPLAMVVVASRPASMAKLRLTAPVTKRVELLGFTKEQILSYIKSFFHANSDRAVELWDYLNEHTSILQLCYLPVHTALLCYMYCKKGDKMPQNETQIYEYFSYVTLFRREMNAGKDTGAADSLNNLAGEVKVLFSKVCQLAFDMTIHSKYTIQQSDSVFPLSKELKDSTQDFVTVDLSTRLFGLENCYAFLHVNFQEYLAAYYLSGRSYHEQIDIITRHIEKPNLHNFWKYFCGNVNFERKQILLDRMFKNKDMDLLTKIHCAFESQQPLVVEVILDHEKSGTLHFNNCNFIASDFVAIAYVLSNNKNSISHIGFQECSFEHNGAKLFIKTLKSDQIKEIKSLTYHKESCTTEDYTNLNTLIKELCHLEILDLEHTELNAYEVEELTKGTIQKQLRVIKIYMPLANIDITHDEALLEMLKLGSTQLQEIHYFTNAGDCLLQAEIYSTLKRTFNCNIYCSQRMKQVLLCNVKLDSSSFSRHQCVHLNYTSMHLINCCMTDSLLEKYAEALPSCRKLRKVHLGFNQISNKGAEALAEAVRKMPHLQVLSAHCNLIRDAGAMKLALAFLNVSIPDQFDLQCNPISPHGISDIWQILSTGCFNLDNTYLCNSLIATEDMAEPKHNLTDFNPELLQLSLNIIYRGSSKHLKSALKCCSYVPSICIYNESISDAHSSLKIKWDMSNSQNVKELSDFLNNCNSMKILSIKNSDMKAENIGILSTGMSKCISLHTVDMHLNNISPWGTLKLSSGLKNCHMLQVLNLDWNDIGSQGSLYLVENLDQCVNLKSLSLNSSSIGSQGA